MNSGFTLPPSTSRNYWTCQLVGWGLVVLAQALIARLSSWPWERALLEMTLWSALLFATHWVRGYARKHNWAGMSLKPLARRCIVASATIGIAFVAALMLLEYLFYGDTRLLRSWTSTALTVNVVGTLLLWHILYFGVVLVRQRQQSGVEEARLRAALRTAELSLLKSQLNPHFLFNALNTVRALINESPKRAEQAVTQLARTLRYSLNASRDELVTLQHELEIVNDYLGIETLRQAERLTIEQDVRDAALPAEIPIMLLQTLVENAVKHGISQLPEGGTLRIAARMEEQTLVIEVSNDRPLVRMGSIPSDRVGLANANERLRLMIGGNASLKLDLSHPQRAVATVRIPQLSATV